MHLKTNHVKSFAHPSFQWDSLGVYSLLRLHLSQRLYIATFCISYTGSLHFCFTLQFWFSCSLIEPRQSSCRLNAVRCVTSNQDIRYTQSREVAPLLILPQ